MPIRTDKTISEQIIKLKNAFEKGERNAVPNDGESEHVRQKKLNETSTLGACSITVSSQQNTLEHNVYGNEPTRSGLDVKKERVSEAFQRPKANISVNPKRIPLSKNKRVKAALDWLSTTFPSCFNTEECLPLKLGISHDISAWIAAAQNNSDKALVDTNTRTDTLIPFPTKTAIRDALSFYTHSLKYQKSLLENDKRYDLNGNEVGAVDAHQKEYARQRKAAIEAVIHARKSKRNALKEKRKLSKV
eukprot:gene23349-30257_t